MKKITLLAVLFLSVIMIANAQNSVRTTAYNYLKKGKLDKAKENIDKAVEHEKTMTDAKTWLYYGNTYIQIATTQDEAYKALDSDALNKAFEGYQKCMEYDEKGSYKIQVLQDMVVISNNFYAKGIELYKQDDFVNAYAEFKEAIKVNNSINNLDTMAVYAAAMSAYSGKMYPEATEGYSELIELGYNNSSIYGDLATIYKEEGKIEEAKAILQQGIETYPNDVNILFAKINILLVEEKYEEVLAALASAIELDPENYTLYFVQGQSYESMEDTENARIGYEKALVIKPDYTDALYNMGALHFNKGVEIAMKANDLPYDAEEEYNKLKEEAIVEYLAAEPYFEKAYELLPDDEELVKSLKQIYRDTKQLEKLTELNNR